MTAGETPALTLDGVAKRFGTTVAVDDVTLHVMPGEFLTVLGPSGSGKTTLLRITGGFEHPDAGRVVLGGSDVTELPPNKRPVNTVFQSYALFPHLNVFDNVAYGLRRVRTPRSQIRERVARMLEIVRLTGLERRKPSTLSGGQQQRVALARALVNRPRVLLLDEPLGALDATLRREMQTELKRIQREVGAAFVFVTHDQEEAMAMSDTIAVMRDGRIEQIGDPTTVYEHPTSAFVASFLGAANLLRGMVARRESGWAAVSLDAGALVWAPDAPTAGARDVKIGVRPEKLRIVRDGDAGDDNVIDGVVEEATFTGVGFHYRIRTLPGDVVSVYEQNAGLPPPRPGERVLLAWKPEHTFALAGAAT